MSCIKCLYDPCVCIEEPTEGITIKVEEETCKVIEERAGSAVNAVADQAARMLTIHHVLAHHCPCDPSAYPSEPTEGITIETRINKGTYSAIFAEHSAADQAARILAAHASIPEPVRSKYDWML